MALISTRSPLLYSIADFTRYLHFFPVNASHLDCPGKTVSTDWPALFPESSGLFYTLFLPFNKGKRTVLVMKHARFALIITQGSITFILGTTRTKSSLWISPYKSLPWFQPPLLLQQAPAPRESSTGTSEDLQMKAHCPHPAAEVVLISLPSLSSVQLMRALIGPCASHIPAQSIITYQRSVKHHSGGTNARHNLYFLANVLICGSPLRVTHVFYFCADVLSSF